MRDNIHIFSFFGFLLNIMLRKPIHFPENFTFLNSE